MVTVPVTGVRMSGAAHRAELPLLVLGPVLGSSAAELWSDCAAHLADAFDLLACDLPGHGHNRAVPDEPFTPADLAAGLLALVADVQEQRGDGGAPFAYAAVAPDDEVGRRLALDHPRRVESIVEVRDPAGQPDEAARTIRRHLLGESEPASSASRRPRTSEAYVYAAARTPFGRFGGALADVRPDDLAASAIAGVLAKTPGLDPALIGDVAWGCANGAGEDNRNVGRMAVLLAGLPPSVPAVTVNRLCGSSLDAAMAGSRTIESGDAEIVLTGGVESMTRAPWVLPKPSRAFPAGDVTAVSTTLGWRLVNERMPAEWTASLGEANEQLADRFGISRERQDEFAARSHRLADAAWDDGFYDDLVVPVAGVDLTRDEGIRPGSTAEKLAGLKASFRPDGTITAANASPLNDGASAVLLGSESARGAIGVDPLARIAGRGTFALVPQDFGIAPVEAVNQALTRAGITWSDVAAVELNEAFAVQSLACLDLWKVDPEIVNTRGGAIAIGHPLGASGGRILGTLAHRLRESGERWGVAAICIGVGQGLAVVLENVG